MWAVKPKSSAWWPPPSMCVADITSLPTRHPSSGSTETSHLASPGSSHVTQISHDGRQFRHRVFPPQLPPWPPQRRWRWLEVRLPRPSESDAPRTGADLPKPEWQSWAQTLPTEERSQLGFHELADRGGGVCENQTHKWVKLESPCRIPGPGRVHLSEEMGPTCYAIPEPVTRPHRRGPDRHPAHRRPAPAAPSRRPS